MIWNKRQNRRGAIGILIFFVILFVILILGFITVMGISILDYTSDVITPVVENIGMVGPANVSQAGVSTMGVVDGFVQSLPWLLVLGYGMALVFSIVFVAYYNINPHPALIGLYFGLILLLIFGAIIISNMYEDIYGGNDEIATRLQDQAAMSFLIIYSPFIFALIAFIAGIYLFAGSSDNGGYGA